MLQCWILYKSEPEKQWDPTSKLGDKEIVTILVEVYHALLLHPMNTVLQTDYSLSSK